MTRKELIEKMNGVKEQMRSIIAKAENEKRGLNDGEKQTYEELRTEAEMLRMKFESEFNVPDITKEQQKSKRSLFLEQVCDIAASNRPTDLDMRAINAEAVVHEASVPVLYQDLIEPLEKGLILDKLGCKVMYDVHGEPMWPFMTGNEASVLGENDEVQDTTLAFETIKSTPKRISMSIPLSNTAINQSNLNLYDIVMRELGMGVSRKLNHIAFDTTKHGDYSGPFVGLTGGNKITHGTKGVYTIADMIKIEHACLDQDVDVMPGNSGYIMNTKTAAILKATPYEKGQERRLLEVYTSQDGKYRYGMMNGYRVEFCNYVADNTIMFGDFRYLGIPQYGDIKITFDPYTLKKKNAVEFTLNTSMDMVRIRKEAFVISQTAGG